MKPATGLVIGKFMPPHAGHLRLFAQARSQVAALSVILFSKPAEPIPGAVRLAWLRELLPDTTIYHIEHEHRVDFADPAAWRFWVEAIRAVLPRPPELVFSSEAYGDELARRLGARHVCVDPARRQVPISASQIRAQPLAFWDYLPSPVRPYFVRRVAVVGAESTGKTTLARALAAYFHTAWAPEFARAYLAAHPGPLTPAGLLHIAREQAASEERQARLADRLLISDTDALTTCLWHERYFGACPPELERLAAGRLADFYLLCGPEVPWVADGLRDSPDWRPWFHRRFQDELSARARPYQVLIGSPAQRLAAAIQAITPLLAAIPA